MAAIAALVAAALAGVLAASSVQNQDPSYRSTAVVEIRRSDLFLDVNPGTISVLNALRSKYAALITTEPVVGPAAEALGLEASQIRGAVGAAITSDSLLFYPYATAAAPAQSERIANAVTEALVSYAEDEQRGAGVPDDGRIELRVVQEAGPGSEIEPNTRRALVVGAGTAALVGLGVYALLELVWVRRRSWVPVGRRSGT